MDPGEYARMDAVEGSMWWYRALHGRLRDAIGAQPGRLLDAGCGTGRVAIELVARGVEAVGVDLDRDMVAAASRKAPTIEWRCADLATVSLGRTFPVVVMAGNVLLFSRPQDRDSIVRNLADHVAPGGVLVAGFSLEPGGYTLAEYDESCRAAGLELADRYATWERHAFAGGAYAVSVHRKP